MPTAIKTENLSKAYQIGQIGTGTISRDLERWWTTTVRGKEDPFLKIGQTNDRTVKGDSDIVWSLRDINFEIEQGDAVGIIGRNGAGKSTLLKLLSRVTAPTTGNIKVKGRIASLLEVGTGFHPELSGRENIYLNGAILGMRKKEITRKLDEIIDFSGVERYIDTPVKRYSSGMYVRLAFAVAAHLESEILIVDEVLAVGDAEFQKKCLGKMGDISKGEGRTVLFVSHNMAAIQNLCTKSLLLENGSFKFFGSTFETVNLYTKGLSTDRSDNQVKSHYIEYACLRNEMFELNNNIKMNSKLYIQFKTNHLINGKQLSFFILDKNNLKVGAFGTAMKMCKTERFVKEEITFEIESIPLVPGTYNIDAVVTQKGMKRLEEHNNILSFSIIESDIYGSGINYNSHFGLIFFKANYSSAKR
jgi:lipopolysaccharide transport system ATP-binding protein